MSQPSWKMKPTFLLFHTESVNEDRNSVCHLVLIPVVNGVRQESIEYFFNPEKKFFKVMSGIREPQVKKFPKLGDVWPEIQELFEAYPIAICSAEAYSAHALYGTLSGLGIPFSPITYCNAKAICRRSLDEVSYSFDYLNFKLYGDCIYVDDPVGIAERWADLIIKGVDAAEDESIDTFLMSHKITKGTISTDGIIPSISKRTCTSKAHNNFDASQIEPDHRPDNPFYGMEVVFTGKMESMKRDDARAEIIKLGGSAPERLTQSTNYLVVGVQDLRVVGEKGLSSKMKTAAKYKEAGKPIEIIDEDDFLEMLKL